MSEILKFFQVIFFFIKILFKAVLGDSNSKRYLTEIFLRLQYDKSRLKKLVIDVPLESNFVYPFEQSFFEPSFKGRERLCTEREVLTLGFFISQKKPSSYLEFGIYKGAGWNLLKANNFNGRYLGIDVKVPEIIKSSGAEFRECDSKSIKVIDICKNGETFDFIFIDGGHDYDTVKSDTELALKVLSPKGLIIWDDYKPSDPGVFKYLNELNQELELFQVEDTSFVVYNSD